MANTIMHMKYNDTTVAVIILLVSLAFCVYMTAVFWGSWAVFFVWLLLPVSALSLAFITGMIFGLFGIRAAPETEQAPIPETTTVTASVLDRSEIFGKYMDEPMYEWLKLRLPSGSEVKIIFVKVLSAPPSPMDLEDGGFAMGHVLYRIQK